MRFALKTKCTISRITTAQREQQGAPWPAGTWIKTSNTTNATTVAEEENDGEIVGLFSPGQMVYAGYAHPVEVR